MFSRFFIERPIFANVIAIVTVILGIVTLVRLPVEQYPPSVQTWQPVSAALFVALEYVVAGHGSGADAPSLQ